MVSNVSSQIKSLNPISPPSPPSPVNIAKSETDFFAKQINSAENKSENSGNTRVSVPILEFGPRPPKRRKRTPQEQVLLLKNFRADSIVKDCELLRKEVLGGGKVSLLGNLSISLKNN